MLVILLVVGFGLTGLFITTRPTAADPGPVNLTPALPTKTDLPGFAHYLATIQPGSTWHSSVYGVSARRTADNASFTLMLHVAPTAQEAEEALRTGMAQSNPAITSPEKAFTAVPQGSYSGRRIGQWVFRTPGKNGRPPRGSFNLTVLDGRAMLTLWFDYVLRDTQGKVVLPETNAADLRLAEDLVLQTLDRLTAMGLTSRPVSSASAQSRAQVRSRLKKMRAGQPSPQIEKGEQRTQ